MDNEELGPCPLCGMEMVSGRSVNAHHLIPKSKDGKAKELCHVICHRKIHSTLTDNELRDYWHTWARLQEHGDIAKYVKWVRRQFNRDPEYIDRHREAKARKRRR